MREIKFRGKSAVTGQWVYGYFRIRDSDIVVIYQEDGFEIAIIAGTEGQFTGLKDKNGKEIYEGDIVKSGKRNFEVVFESASFMMCFAKGSSMMFINEMVEIIGNIYEEQKHDHETITS